MRKSGKIITNIFVCFVVAMAVCIMIFTIVTVNTVNRSDRKIFGYSAYIVMSDSMSKTDFDAGDVILIKEVEPSTLKAGDIIAYKSQDGSNYGETITHKIRRQTTTVTGEPGFVTYGTTTDTDDKMVVTYPCVLGKYEICIPKVGSFFHFLRTPLGYAVCILLPFLMILVMQGVNTVKLYQKYKAEKVDAFKAERMALEEERRQTEEKMKELQALKEQLGMDEVQSEDREKEVLSEMKTEEGDC
ncbi:MAG: signal peptidase I [Lachnospiraceae bacterium]|nr:signal peptidase I [Lachnospiraceae bacterium]